MKQKEGRPSQKRVDFGQIAIGKIFYEMPRLIDDAERINELLNVVPVLVNDILKRTDLLIESFQLDEIFLR